MSAHHRLLAVLALALAACSQPRPAATPTSPQNQTAPSETPGVTSPSPSLPPPTSSPRPPTATITLTPTPTATPAPALRQLTTGGCCVQPAWSPDGSEIWFIDRPSETEPSGLWAVPASGGQPRFVTDRLGIRSPDGQLNAYPEAGQTYIERPGGDRWTVPSAGRSVDFSPDSTQIAWQAAYSTVNFDRRQVEIWLANVDGTGARRLLTLDGGGLVDWMPDGQRLLISGRDVADRESFYALYDLAAESYAVLVRASQLRGALVSPDGAWLAYQVAFSGNPEADGLWIQTLADGPARRLDIYGAYRWRNASELMVLPLEPGAPGQRVLAVSATTGEIQSLTDPAVTPFRIAGGDWALSPGGREIVFVSAEDRNLWVLELTR